MKPDFVLLANRYADSVVNGERKAARWERLACQRFKRDLERVKNQDPDWPFVFSWQHAERACRAISAFPHTRGEKAGQPLGIEGWQAFIIANVFGWLNKETGKRRFRYVYIEVPRKNGKSTLTAGVGLYMLALDNEAGAEIYSAATSRDQARIVFDTARLMAEDSPQFCRKFGVAALKHALTGPAGSSFKPLAAVDKTLEGLNPHCAIIDELHAHPSRRVYDVLKTAQGARAQPLLWVITTAGDSQESVCFEQHRYLKQVLDRQVCDDTLFGVIYTLDIGDDWTDPENFVKANPNYNISVHPDMLSSACAQAQQELSQQNAFKTRHLGIWVNAASAWMDMDKWNACADTTLRLEDFEGRPCVIGLDLASKKDIASKVLIFWDEPTDEDSEKRPNFYVFATHYLPEAAVVASNNASYPGWAESGCLTVTPGPITDIGAIEDAIREDCDRFEVREIAYDPHQATQLANRLLGDGYVMVEIRPSPLNFSEPMKELEALTLAGRIHHTGDPVLSWMVSNVTAKEDHKENIYPRKNSTKSKIDGVVASIMALNRGLVHARQDDTPKKSVYEDRGFIEL